MPLLRNAYAWELLYKWHSKETFYNNNPKVISKPIQIVVSEQWGNVRIFSWEPALWTLNSQDRVMLLLRRSQKSIAIFGYKQSLLSVDMKTKVVQHVEREWTRECESEIVTFEHIHENKSSSACQEWVNERVKELESVSVREC